MLTQKRAMERLLYDPESGALLWRTSSGRAHAGKNACSSYGNGYLRVCIDGREYLAHRVIWLMEHGEWPSKEIDHINGSRTDNRITNLRQATSAQNKQNARMRSDNSSGYPGVSWFKCCNKWRADIQGGRKQNYLGVFDTAELAHEAYEFAKSLLHTFSPSVR